MECRLFAPEDADRWDAFCERSYNATFLETRRFLSYHGGRFVDRSAIFEHDGEWWGVLPAALDPSDPSTVVSHPGITYGNVVHHGRLRGEAMVRAFELLNALHGGFGLSRFRYKALPVIYHRAPAQDDLYALQRIGARRYRCDLSTCIDLAARLPVSDRRRRGLRKAVRAGVAVQDGSAHLAALWSVLAGNLERKHGTRPVHTLGELQELCRRFPDAIGSRVATVDGEVVAGVVVFRSAPARHLQYIASSDAGYAVNALDAVVEHCIAEALAQGDRYFDFGISTERAGTRLNEGLHAFKSEFGGSGVVHEFYEWEMETTA